MLISSKENPQIKLYGKLVNSKKTRNEMNMFPLEGLRLVLDSLKENTELYCAFVTETAVKKYGEAVDLLTEKIGEKLYTITDEIGMKISDTNNTQGVFAISYKNSSEFNIETLKANEKYLILDSLQDPGNVGTILRTADAVGIDGIFLTEGCCDIYNPKTVRSAMGSLFRVKTYYLGSFENIVEAFKTAKIKTYASVIDKDAKDIKSADFSNGCAVVIGNEGRGMTVQDANLCDEKITIKMNGNIDSLNAASAASIILWEMTK